MTDFQDDPIDDTGTQAFDEPTVISVAIGGESITLIDFDDDQVADVTIEHHPDDTVDVTVAEDQQLVEVDPVTDETVADEDPAVEPVVEDPEPSASDIILTLPGEGAGMAPETINAGPATFDTDGDQRPDAAVIDDGANLVLVKDTTGDGVADDVVGVDAQSGEQVFHYVNDGKGWVDGAATPEVSADPATTDPATTDPATTDPATTDPATTATGEFEVPAQFLNPPTYAEGDPTMQMVIANATKTLALQAGEIWPAAYPGKPWPLDDAGEPYAPEVLLRIVINDDKLKEENFSLTKTAQETLTSYQGILNTIVKGTPGLQATGDGEADAVASELSDGSAINLLDTDGDGSADVVQLAGTDGSVTTIEDPGPGMHLEVVDEAGNPVASADDTDQSGTIEDSEVVAAETPETIDTTDTSDTTTGTTVDLIDPESVVIDPTADTVMGDPVVAAEYWLFQGEAGTCAPTSVAMVLSEILDIPMQSNHDVVERAIELGLIGYDSATSEWTGMDDRGMLLLLESYGVDCNARFGDLDDLMAYLDAGHLVMVGVDADEVRGTLDDANEIGWGEDHALMVTAIDPVNGLVYLNNPNEAGGPSVIPLDQFVEAWDDGFNSMIVTDLPADEAGAAVDAATIADLSDREPGADDPFTDDDAAALITEIEDTSTSDAGLEPGTEPDDVDVDAGGPDIPTVTPGDGFDPLPIEDVDTVPDGLRKLLILPFALVVIAAARVRRSR